MATASHEHIPDLSASLSKSHHRAPISDLWGPSLSQKARSMEASSDYAIEIARDTSRGPLMSSACSTSGHENHEEPAAAADPVPISAKVGSALWSSSPGHSAVASNTPSSAGSAPSSGVPTPSGSAPLPLRGLTPSNSPSYRGSHTTGPTPVGSVAPMSHYRSGIWGPRRSFSAYNGQAAFQQPPSTGSVYGKTPWAVDLGAPAAPNAAAAAAIPGVHGMPGAPMPNVPSPVNSVAASVPSSVPVQPGFYGMPHGVSSSMPPSSPLQKMTPPPRSSPSPPAMTGNQATRLYQPRASQAPPSGGAGAAAPMHQPQAVQNVQAVQPPLQQQQQQQQQLQQQQQQQQQAMRGHHGHHQGGHHSGHEGRPAKKNGRPSTNTELYKTELCASYMSTGGNCPYGEKCQFAHGPEELKSVDRPPKWRSKPCQNWVKTGSCSYNERCCFRHDVPVGHGQS